MRKQRVEPSDNTVLRDEFFFTNEEQFLTHTKKHIDNVNKIGEQLIKDVRILLKEDPTARSHFNIPEDANVESFFSNFKELMKVHDIAKTSEDPAFLERHNLDEPIYKKLALSAGKFIDEDERKEIEVLNNIDKAEMKSLVQKMGLPKWQEDVAEIFEKICDQIDRGNNPITAVEMNKDPRKTSDYGKSRPDIEQTLIKDLESHYDEKMLPEMLLFAETTLTSKKDLPKLEIDQDPKNTLNKKVEGTGYKR